MERRPGKLEQAVAVCLSLVAMWYMIPAHQRQLFLMRMANLAGRVAGRAARLEGRAGMRDELGGQPGEAERRYSAAYALGRVRDAFARVYEKARP